MVSTIFPTLAEILLREDDAGVLKVIPSDDWADEAWTTIVEYFHLEGL
jgi:hypothetical protein